jgi:MFS family permease
MDTTTSVSSASRPVLSRFAIAAIFCLNGLMLANWFTRIPDVKNLFQLTEQSLSFVLLCTAVGALISQPIVGMLIGRFGSHNIIRIMLLAFVLSLSLPGLVTSLPMLMLALFVVGALNGGLDVAMNSQASLVEQRYQKPIMSSFHGLWSVGSLIGAVIGGFIAEQGLGISQHLFLVVGVGLVLALPLLKPMIVDTNVQAGGPSFALPPRALLVLGAISFGVLFCEGAVADWSAVFMRESLLASPSTAAMGYAMFSLTMAIGRLAGDGVAQRFRPEMVVRGGGVFVAVGFLMAVLSGNITISIIGFALVGIGLAATFPLVISAAAQTPGVHPSLAITAMSTIGYTGFLIGPPLIGTIADAISLRNTLGLLAVVGILVVIFGGAVRTRQNTNIEAV